MIDASIALGWVLPDESHHDVLGVLEAAEPRWHAPAHWMAEVANGLLMAERRQRIDVTRARQSAVKLSALDVALDNDGVANAFRRVLPLARAHGLTIYDALYLELAERLGFPLATLDGDLRQAARTIGLKTLP